MRLLWLVACAWASAASALSASEWVQVPFALGPSKRRWHTAVFEKGFWIFGGDDGALKNDLWSFKTIKRMWLEMPQAQGTPWPSPRFSHMAVVQGGAMWVFGGVVQSGLSDDLWAFDFDLEQWNFLDVHGPSARESMSMVADEGQLWMFGGYDGASRNDLWSFDCLLHTWNLVEAATGPSERFSHVAIQYGEKMWIFGGLSLKGLENDLWTFDLTDHTWMQLQATAQPSARESATAVVSVGQMWLFGGLTEDLAQSNELWSLDLADANWSLKDPGSGPAGNKYHVAAADEDGRMWCHNGDLWYFNTNPTTTTTSSTVSSTSMTTTETITTSSSSTTSSTTSSLTSSTSSTTTSSTSRTSTQTSTSTSSTTSSVSSTTTSSTSTTSSMTTTTSSTSSTTSSTTSITSSTTSSSSSTTTSMTTSSSSTSSTSSSSSTTTSRTSTTSSTSSTTSSTTSVTSSTTSSSTSTTSSKSSTSSSSTTSTASSSSTTTSRSSSSTSSTTSSSTISASSTTSVSSTTETGSATTSTSSTTSTTEERDLSLRLQQLLVSRLREELSSLDVGNVTMIPDDGGVIQVLPTSQAGVQSLGPVPLKMFPFQGHGRALISRSMDPNELPLPEVNRVQGQAHAMVLAGPITQILLLDEDFQKPELQMQRPMLFRASSELVEGALCSYLTKDGWSSEGLQRASETDVREAFADVSGTWCATSHLSVFTILRPCSFQETLTDEECFDVPTVGALMGGGVLCLFCSLCGCYASVKSKRVVGGKMQLADTGGCAHEVPFHVKRSSSRSREQPDKTLITWDVLSPLQSTSLASPRRKPNLVKVTTKFFNERKQFAMPSRSMVSFPDIQELEPQATFSEAAASSEAGGAASSDSVFVAVPGVEEPDCCQDLDISELRLTPTLFQKGSLVEYFSETHQKWLTGSIQSLGPDFEVRIYRQVRHQVPVERLRLPFHAGDCVEVNLKGTWTEATVQARRNWPLAYKLQVDNRSGIMAAAEQLRPSFSEGDEVFVFSEQTWLAGHVVGHAWPLVSVCLEQSQEITSVPNYLVRPSHKMEGLLS